MLTSINIDGMMSYDKSSLKVMSKVKNQKKADKIIKNVYSSNLDEIATDNNTEVQTALSVNLSNPVISGVGNEPSVVGYAMGINKETTSSAIRGNTGVFFIYVTDRRKASSLENYKNMLNRISSSRSSNVRANSFNALKDKAEIEDFRSLFY
jgi:peptidyl-prolyl cis-trans isomerase D